MKMTRIALEKMRTAFENTKKALKEHRKTIEKRMRCIGKQGKNNGGSIARTEEKSRESTGKKNIIDDRMDSFGKTLENIGGARRIKGTAQEYLTATQGMPQEHPNSLNVEFHANA